MLAKNKMIVNDFLRLLYFGSTHFSKCQLLEPFFLENDIELYFRLLYNQDDKRENMLVLIAFILPKFKDKYQNF